MIIGTEISLPFNPQAPIANLDARMFNNQEPWDSLAQFLAAVPMGSRKAHMTINILGVEYSLNPDRVTAKIKTNEAIVTYASMIALLAAAPTNAEFTYQTLDDMKTYKYNGSGGYALISDGLALGLTSSTAYAGDNGNNLLLIVGRFVKDYNPAYNFKGFAISEQAPPVSPVLNDVYYYTGLATSTVFGIAGVTEGVFLVYGSVWNVVTFAMIEPVRAQDFDKLFVSGKNLFDKSKATDGAYVYEPNGDIDPNAAYAYSDYIPVKSSVDYFLSGNGSTNHMAWYDLSKVFISGSMAAYPLLSPINAAFARISCAIGSKNTTQFEEGGVATTYEPYSKYISDALIGPIDTNKILDSSIPAIKTNFITTGKNIFNKDATTLGMYVNDSNGDLWASAGYYASDFIIIEPSTAYCETYGYFLAFYDASKIYISGLGNTGVVRTFTTPSSAKYVRISVAIEWINSFQLEKGSVSTAFERFGYKLVNSLYDNANDEVLCFLPSEIFVASGRTIELYNNQVAWCGNIDNYHFVWNCAIGKAMKRKFSVTGTDLLISNYPLTLTIYDNNMNAVASASTTIKVVSNVIASAENILTIGDSLSNDKPWYAELSTISTNKLLSVGTRWGTAGLKHEGRSGWSAATYLTGASYTYEGEGVNPFWDGTRFNYANYKTVNSITPNAIQIFLGTNGMELNSAANSAAIKQIVDYIRQDDATIKIYVVFTLYRGNQDGIGNEIATDGYAMSVGNWKLQEDRKVFNLMVALNGLLSGYSNLHFIPIALTHDSEFNFGAISTPVNPRASQTELLPSQATHPQNQGYFQFADTMFSTLAGTL